MNTALRRTVVAGPDGVYISDILKVVAVMCFGFLFQVAAKVVGGSLMKGLS